MSEKTGPVSVRILDKEYLISCTEEQRELLYEAAASLNAPMQELKDKGRIMGTERVAVMTALNLANELLAYKKRDTNYNSSVDSIIKRLQRKIDNALVEGRQLQI